MAAEVNAGPGPGRRWTSQAKLDDRGSTKPLKRLVDLFRSSCLTRKTCRVMSDDNQEISSCSTRKTCRVMTSGNQFVLDEENVSSDDIRKSVRARRGKRVEWWWNKFVLDEEKDVERWCHQRQRLMASDGQSSSSRTGAPAAQHLVTCHGRSMWWAWESESSSQRYLY